MNSTQSTPYLREVENMCMGEVAKTNLPKICDIVSRSWGQRPPTPKTAFRFQLAFGVSYPSMPGQPHQMLAFLVGKNDLVSQWNLVSPALMANLMSQLPTPDFCSYLHEKWSSSDGAKRTRGLPSRPLSTKILSSATISK